tara:strand:+ start:146 stop:1291 length:1146 start_codon:yes stop_codon:yes gene_type:complete
MNHNEDIAFNSIKIISNTESYDKNSGSIVINGGIGCKKTIHCENLCAKNSFFNNITISGAINNINFDNFTAEIGTINNLNSTQINVSSIDVNKILFQSIIPDVENNNIGNDEFKVNIISNKLLSENATIKNLIVDNITIDSFKFEKLIPKNYNSQIGNQEYRINLYANKIDSNFVKINEDLYAKIIYGEKLNINNDILLSIDYKNKKMIQTNSNESQIDINAEVININNPNNNLKISDDGIKLKGLIILDHIIIDMNKYEKKFIYPKDSLIFLTGSRCHDVILSNQSVENDVNSIVANGTYIKIVNLSKVNVIINEYILNNNGSYYEFIFIEDKWICLNKGKSKSDKIIKIEGKDCVCDTEDETIEDTSYCQIDSDERFSI